MTILFIADLHLSESEPHITEGFLKFLKHDAVTADALYILGDLFEVWIGDDDPNPLHSQIAEALAELHQHGVPCYFIHGNRDFLLGKGFAQKSHMLLLPEETVINLYGERVLILHGDTLCTDDQNYQRFRRIMHNKVIQFCYLALPLFIRQRIARRLRNESQQNNRSKSALMMDVNSLAVASALQRYQVMYMIHGHTHRPAVHDMTISGKLSHRIVLGSWENKGSVLKVSKNNQFELISFPLP